MDPILFLVILTLVYAFLFVSFFKFRKGKEEKKSVEKPILNHIKALFKMSIFLLFVCLTVIIRWHIRGIPLEKFYFLYILLIIFIIISIILWRKIKFFEKIPYSIYLYSRLDIQTLDMKGVYDMLGIEDDLLLFSFSTEKIKRFMDNRDLAKLKRILILVFKSEGIKLVEIKYGKEKATLNEYDSIYSEIKPRGKIYFMIPQV